MKKYFQIISISFLLIFINTSCEKYLDRTAESDGLTQEEVFSDYLKTRQFMDGMFLKLFDFLDGNDQAFLGAVCEEGYTNSEWETMPVVQGGNWLDAYSTEGAMQFYQVWQDSWAGIRIANIGLQNMHLLEGHATQSQINELLGQAYFFRAWFYYELLRRQGGMPYITEPLKSSDNFALPRLSYEETAAMIANDCDTATNLLPGSWSSSDKGRPTKGAAMALKSTVLLFAASPTNNPSGNTELWDKAAQAAWAFINYAEQSGQYKLYGGSEDISTVKYMTPEGEKEINYKGGGRDSVFLYTFSNEEIIWEDYRVVNFSPYNTFGPANLVPHARLTGYSPSQNMVDRFETQNGLAIQDDPNYDSDNPYIDRDPRFYQSILFNQRQWTTDPNKYLELFNGGSERTGEKYYSYTGYLSNKYWPSNVSNISNTTPPLTHRIYLRYADILLQYAESANELGGPNHAIAGANITPVQAVNMIRDRVHMPPVNSLYTVSKETFRERIRNERAVELYLENKRFFDLKRWHLSSNKQYKDIYGVDIVSDDSKPTGFEFSKPSVPVVSLTFDEKHYRFPIPADDATMFEEFKQNPGW